MSDQWTDVEVPQGRFIGWGEVGQVVAGKVVNIALEGGTDFNGNPCPQLTIELLDDTTNFTDKGTVRETLPKGDLATLTCGQANLRRSIQAANLEPGDLVRIGYVGTYKTGKGEGKEFKVQKAPGPRETPAPAVAASDIFGS